MPFLRRVYVNSVPDEGRAKYPVRRSLMVALSALCAAFVLGVVAWERIEAQSATVFIASDRLEKANSVSKLVAMSNQRLDTFASDYATWDDMVDYVNRPDNAWVRRNVDAKLSVYNADYVWIFDKYGNPIHSAARHGHPEAPIVSIPRDAFAECAKRKNRYRFFVVSPHGYVQIFGATIRPTSDLQGQLPLSGYLFAGKQVGSEYLTTLATLSDCHVTVVPATTVNLKGSYREIMRNPQGDALAALDFATETATEDLVRSSHESSIALFVAFSLAILIATFLAVLRWVSQPLNAISASLVSEDPERLEELAGTGTEFGQLARLVRAFFNQRDTLQSEMKERLRIQQELIAAHDDLEHRVAERTRELREEIAERHRVEVALRDAEEKYRSIFENTLEGIYQTTPGGRYLDANPALARIYGYDSPEELIETLEDINSKLYVDEKRRQRFKSIVEEDGFISGFESEVRRKDGSITWISENARVVRGDDGQVLYYEGTVEDVSERKQSELEIFRLNAHLEERLGRIVSLRRIDSAINSSHELSATMQVFLREVTDQLRVDAAAILSCDTAAYRLRYVASTGFHAGMLRQMQYALGTGHAGQAAIERKTVHVRDIATVGDSALSTPQIAQEGFATYFAVPLIAKGQVKGVLEVYHRTILEPDQEWLDFLDALAGQAAIAIDNAGLFEGLQRTNIELSIAYDATIEGWSRALDLRDKETEGHSQRVTEMSIRLAEMLGVGDVDLLQIRRGALLHDIGKMGIPDQILLKPGPLSDQEWAIMKRHPVYAYEMLSPIEFLRPALDIPYCHHERWDGMGYPRGLQGEGIPLAARIFAIVDVWDALRSDRPYRPGWPVERIREHIQSMSGRHFDPNVVTAFIAMIDSDEFPECVFSQAA